MFINSVHYITNLFYTFLIVAASLFGNHVLTFDKKYYELVENKTPGCGYLLAHDFGNNQFTLKKEGEAIVVDTPDMSIAINKNGKTKARIGKQVISTLPVESKSGNCIRKDALVKCYFMSKNFKVVVDLKNDITTLSMSGWYYGKTQGKHRIKIHGFFKWIFT